MENKGLNKDVYGAGERYSSAGAAGGEKVGFPAPKSSDNSAAVLDILGAVAFNATRRMDNKGIQFLTVLQVRLERLGSKRESASSVLSVSSGRSLIHSVLDNETINEERDI
ncbi:uncharacterized protein LOC127281601 [Leptopilina boulardi]|uniref:uncharacterized protein LOC127281601 n=1 Tax=Leptopilina boulardi TaxID=63433 RepID=UPI0021F5289F|nr:uncharacterized protein LOC127281601 [Leptopilina boulardi]